MTEKNKAWEEITISYNAQPEVNVKRNVVQLRKLWCNLKQRKRKETTALRHSMLATGGGPLEKKPQLDPVLEMVEDAAPYMDQSLICNWDSTALFEQENAAKLNSILEEAAKDINSKWPEVLNSVSILPSLCLSTSSSCRDDLAATETLAGQAVLSSSVSVSAPTANKHKKPSHQPGPLQHRR
ncbi:Myb/SANT-like DNA-binding domain [Popillia japonica]|uniref:Regulatory protein zeste n=1 Tax=Popillia japonica TaxID=7064 RepID=A0AAW1JFL0_POPJA